MVKNLPEFRKDLDITPRSARGGGFQYLIRDPRSGEIYELGEEEHFLCDHFDGCSDYDSLLELFRKRFGIAIESVQLEAFARQMESLGLCASKEMRFATRPGIDPAKRIYRVFDPNRLFGLLAGIFGFCFSRVFLVAGILLLASGMGVTVKFWQDYLMDLGMIRDSGLIFFFPLFGIFFFNPTAEITKGVACRKYGGCVHRFNVSFIYRIIPLFFSDLLDSMLQMPKSVRTRLLFSAIFSQVLLWAVGMIAWRITVPGTPTHTFWTLFTFASALFALMRINPLLEQDGYALLRNWLDIPDLRNRAKRLARSWVLRKPLPEPLFPKEIAIFKRYGLPALVFEILFWVLALTIAGRQLVHSLNGVGACLFAALLLCRFENRLNRFFSRVSPRRWKIMSEAGRLDFRLVGRLALIGAFVVVLLLPYPYESGGDFSLLPVHERGIRTQVPGEIEAVFVTEGDWVRQGQVLGKLTGREQRKKVEELEASIEKSRANLTLLQNGATPKEIAKARQEVKAAETAFAYSNSQAERSEKMFRDKALSEKDYESSMRTRDMDRERVELARKNMDVVQSGFRPEQIRAVQAEIRALEVELKNAREDFEFIDLRCPIDGRVITPKLSEKVGHHLATGDLFAVVEDARTLTVEILLPEDELGECDIGAPVRLRTWAYPNTLFHGRVCRIAPVAFERSRNMIERAYSDREWLIEQNQTLREKGRVVRVLCEIDNPEGVLKTEMTGYAKIRSKKRPVVVAFTRWLMRFVFVEIWSWIP